MSIHIHAVTNGNPDNFDTGPLSWVIEEIREALHRSKTALLDAIVKDSESSATLLNHANTYLHQAHGALQIVDVHGVNLVTEAVEEVLRGMADKQIPASLDNAKLIENIYQALMEYLEDLLNGAPQKPIYLYPFYKELKEKVGTQRMHPADLFFPNFANRTTWLDAETSDAVGAADESINYAELRQRFEKLLLLLLRNSSAFAGTEETAAMQDIIAKIKQAQSARKLNDFWQVMEGFAQMAHDGQFSNELYVKLVFARINLQIRQLAERSDHISERLLREALFLIACANAFFARFSLRQKMHWRRRRTCGFRRQQETLALPKSLRTKSKNWLMPASS
jgi:chemosensory pili system protein ChpA (sensor histidine kinase/response regulator)